MKGWVAILILAASLAAAQAASAGTLAPALGAALTATRADQPVSVIVHMAPQVPIARLDGGPPAGRAVSSATAR